MNTVIRSKRHLSEYASFHKSAVCPGVKKKESARISVRLVIFAVIDSPLSSPFPQTSPDVSDPSVLLRERFAEDRHEREIRVRCPL
ncbi:MAG: hypothetical protein ACK2TV_11535 [Anaerolineales bacterium]